MTAWHDHTDSQELHVALWLWTLVGFVSGALAMWLAGGAK
jgi:hypothetical protein